jgi:hypothetical protein
MLHYRLPEPREAIPRSHFRMHAYIADGTNTARTLEVVASLFSHGYEECSADREYVCGLVHCMSV